MLEQTGGVSPLKAAEVFTMDKEEALRQFQLYQEAVKRQRDAADVVLMQTFKALSEGFGVLNLPNVMKQAGVHEANGRPKLAVMRADQAFAYWRRVDTGGFFSYDVKRYMERRVKGGTEARLQFYFADGTFPHVEQARHDSATGYWKTCRAPVPLIPPEFRPKDAPRNYNILWEVDADGWTTVEPPRPASDPILLRPTGAPGIYAVVAHWDLKPVERMVLGALLAGN